MWTFSWTSQYSFDANTSSPTSCHPAYHKPTNAATVKIYDNTAASGTMLVPTLEIPTSADNRGEVWSWEPPLAVSTGIYVDVTCSGTVKYVIYYRRQ